ncbi:MAG TPA: hypothetical protein VEY30_13200 [Myxococcaceae bacterium]|nr:hypothetical protein [Myxococcaceae bacterium]
MGHAEHLKLVVTVPQTHADAVRRALGEAGAGRLGAYAFCSFSVLGVGRFLPQAGARPAVGEVGRAEEVAEERIEVSCDRAQVAEVIRAVRAVHPYEEPVFDLYPLLELPA